tara:strand:- start:374 stop:889 length:516 start_codon:yes stop_codon:yes gene_type:complete
MNNQIYGLTTGQISPTSRLDMKTKSTPYGNVETPINPITSAIMNGASYVARAYSGDIRHTTAIIKAAIEHKGFSLVDIFSPCVTFNDDNSHDFFKERVSKLEDQGHDAGDWKAACEKAIEWGPTINIGLFFQNKENVSLGAREPVLADGPLSSRTFGISEDQTKKLLGRMM